MNKYEEIVKEDLQEKNWNVLNLEPGLFIFNKFSTEEEKSLASCISQEVGRAKFQVGCPDMLCYRFRKEDSFDYEITDLKFVEVKGPSDSVKTHQIRWLASCDIFTEFAFVRTDLDIDYFKADIDLEEGSVINDA